MVTPHQEPRAELGTLLESGLYSTGIEDRLERSVSSTPDPDEEARLAALERTIMEQGRAT